MEEAPTTAELIMLAMVDLAAAITTDDPGAHAQFDAWPSALRISLSASADVW